MEKNEFKYEKIGSTKGSASYSVQWSSGFGCEIIFEHGGIVHEADRMGT
jgi:hypothetical protein